ncbi:MAG: sigma-70 family RNA polymerase sigma factor [Acidobacteria bacterium]|nr:sigma-70 family RNA polymerase sigma factor [Acidobacteriota bacterium]MCW5971484.1 sigma-70 family RNA polymerase sigma factor [Blastocatellales bacterium]
MSSGTATAGRKGMAFGELAPGVVARAKDGDEEAFHLIFNRYGRPILSFINHLVQDRDLAEDLAQETFVRAHRNLKALREEARFSTWLFGIARNVVYEASRQARRDEKHIPLDTPESQRLESKDLLPEGMMRDRELNEAISRALATLDDDKRTVFSLKIFHEKSYEEISEITGYSIGKLKTDLHRARAEMRRRIAPYLAERA